jgi:hypothetical protein
MKKYTQDSVALLRAYGNASAYGAKQYNNARKGQEMFISVCHMYGISFPKTIEGYMFIVFTEEQRQTLLEIVNMFRKLRDKHLYDMDFFKQGLDGEPLKQT